MPRVLAEDLDNGYLLLSDLGSTTYLQALDEGSADALYRAANEALLRIQLASRPGALPEYDRALLLRDLEERMPGVDVGRGNDQGVPVGEPSVIVVASAPYRA